MNTVLNIAIVSHHFYPEVTPRAFRAYELARQLAAWGHRVSVFIPQRCVRGELAENEGFKYIVLPDVEVGQMPSGLSFWKHWALGVGLKLSGTARARAHAEGYVVPFAVALAGYGSFDMLVSVGLPKSVHASVALAHALNPQLARVMVADYGDPYSYNLRGRSAIVKRKLEAWWIKHFDFVTVPIGAAKKAYASLIAPDKILVIPQGIDLQQYTKGEYVPNEIPTFIYTGVFTPHVRDPYELVNYLIKRKEPYRFRIFTDIYYELSMNLLRPLIETRPDAVEVHHLVDRQTCINELSKADFSFILLYNEDDRLPSKVMDCKIAQRPIFAYQHGKFDAQIFEQFIKGDYTHDISKDIDLSFYSIENVARQFVTLANTQKK
jgi:hypothetical protein